MTRISVLLPTCEPEALFTYFIPSVHRIQKLNSLLEFNICFQPPYTEEQINEVIGQDPKNQFVLNAMEVFRQEMLKIEKEKEKTINSLIHEQEAEFDKIREKYNNKIDKINEFYENEIKNIQNQIQELMKQNSI